MPDGAVIERALDENRVVLTEDMDFGKLVRDPQPHQKEAPKVILIRRFESLSRRAKCREVIKIPRMISRK